MRPPLFLAILVLLICKPIVCRNLLHVVNFVSFDRTTLPHEMKWTAFSMRSARNFAKHNGINVTLISAVADEDRRHVGPDFELCTLNRFTSTVFPNVTTQKTKLPFVRDTLNCAASYASSHSDIVVLTNSDIMVAKHFYTFISGQCPLNQNRSDCSLEIMRRDLENTDARGELSPAVHDRLASRQWQRHPGHDCFAFSAVLLKKLRLGNLFFAYPPWGLAVKTQLEQASPQHRAFTSDHGLTFHFGSAKEWLHNSAPTKGLWEINIAEWDAIQKAMGSRDTDDTFDGFD